ncbi:Synaptotagmin-17 [Pteropus alecto]|uniref:Synaptotagmin-17 n=1 Tax=Pteropus alecto TaxID=9402 RepID=L5KP65_PTEAL|nr:Synaptotagmin-17 [Pteropus alecto]
MLKFPVYSVLVSQEATSSPENSNTLLGSQLPSQDVSKQKWKTFCSKRSQQRQTLNVISHQGWAACNSGVFPLPPLHPSRIPSPPPPSTAHLPQWPQGFLSRISDLLLCRWTCRHCCQKCYESSCCQSSEDEVEILGPFPAQTPPWLMASRGSDKDGDSVHTVSDVPLTPRTNSPDRRCSSSDTSKSTYSLTRRISSLEARRPSSPLIDIKPIEFGVLGAKKEPIQPSVLRRTYTPDDYFRKFEPRLYSLDGGSDDVDFLTDEEISSKYQLGMLHFSTQYDLLHNHLTVRVIEARDLPPPIAQDGARQDLAHSNPYVKVCLLPDQKNSKQTAVKRKTQRPVFEERYTFEIPFLEAQRRTLLLTVLDFDKFSRHCVIGKVAVPLCEVDLVKGGHWWKALIPSSQNEVELGELLLSLNYLPSAGRLNVDVIRAKQLLQTDVSQGSVQEAGAGGTKAKVRAFAAGYNIRFDTYSKMCVNGDGGHLLWQWMKVQPKRKGILRNAITWNLTKVLTDENGCMDRRHVDKSLCSWRRSRPATCDSTSVHPSPEPTASAPRSLPRGAHDSLPGNQPPDPFVKIQLVHGLKLVKTKKTSFLRGTIDPFYNESFSFKVPQEELENASLVFTVFGHNMKSSNDFIGRIVIGQYSSGPSEANHWRRMLNTHRTAVGQWHSLRSRAECDRVSPASLEVT